MACAICETRRPRRFCPGVGGEICSQCCGAEREVTVNCPLDCEFLQEARKHEKRQEVDFEKMPNQDIRVSEKLLQENESLLVFVGRTLAEAELRTPGAVDGDVREALDGLIRTYRTLQSGVYYESVPDNPLAAEIYRTVQRGVEEFRRQEQQKLGMSKTRDGDVLAILVFLQRVEYDRNNGRPRGRAFLDMLIEFYGVGPVSATSRDSPLILP